MMADVVVIGCGLAGLSAALKLNSRNKDVILVKKSTGATFFSSGAIDVAGYYPMARDAYYDSPKECIKDIKKLNTNHPYSKLGDITKIESLYNEWLKLINEEYKLKGSFDKNIQLINFTGTIKPSNLAAPPIYNGNLKNLNGKSLALLGIVGFPDFNPKYCQKSLENILSYLNKYELKSISHFHVNLDKLSEINNLHSMTLAQYLETEENLNIFIKNIKADAEILKYDVLAFPSILGVMNSDKIVQKLKESLKIEVIELLSYPPSVPGYRLQSHLEKLAIKKGIKLLEDLEITNFQSKNNELKSVNGKYGKYKELSIEANEFILATGKYIGGGIKEEKNFIKEGLFNLPIFDEFGRPALFEPLQKMFKPKVLPKEGQPFLSVGIKINDSFKPIDSKNQVIFENLKAAGLILSGYNYVSEKNGLGVAFLTGMAAGGN
ncbi:MAG: anaerobic glycerol-3-phosphate dehydrogenase subunit B [Candidatus Lokiarchaeota archaeon]|nr:anaerobic glycerol-3-phosphate dehydrogenase subunit B [Candidatus Lokiarchaeota archaeon]